MDIPIVIVDDEPIDRYLAKRVIKEMGVPARVAEEKSGDLFIELIDDKERFEVLCGTPPPPTLVLLDINMPRMDGFEVLEALESRYASEQHNSSCFVVMMFTSSENIKDRDRAFQYDFVKDFIVKPFDEEQLSRILRDHYGLSLEGE